MFGRRGVGITLTFLTAFAVTAGGVTSGFAETGLASIYSYHGSRTASGERARAAEFTAAHRTLPFGTMVRVTNRTNGHTVMVRINDRGPFKRGRVIDVTPAAASSLGFSGLTRVTLDVIDNKLKRKK
jgi:rare lipoprotein A